MSYNTKNKIFAGILWPYFSTKNAKIWKTENIRFQGMVSFILLQIFKCIALKLKKKINEGECFDVTYVHRGRMS